MPRISAVGLQRNLVDIGKVVPPRVTAAEFGRVWNRRCTARRFQMRLDCGNLCQLG